MLDREKKEARARRFIQAALNSAKTEAAKLHVADIRIYTEGYADHTGDIVALGNWNDITKWDDFKQQSVVIDKTLSRLGDALEKIGVDVEWDDCWVVCHKCGRLIGTEPTHYGWQPSFAGTEEGPECLDCLDPVAHLASLEGDRHEANSIRQIKPTKYDYVEVKSDYESGYHWGQDASPALIAEALEKQGITRFIFNVESLGQFDTRFGVYVHKSEIDLLDREKFDKENTDGPSNAGRLQRSLQKAEVEVGKLQGEGVKYVKIEGDNVEARVIPPQEFIENGIKEKK